MTAGAAAPPPPPPPSGLCDSPKTKAVCVMDASGRLGSALVDRLLRSGYIVHAALHTRQDLEGYKEGWSESNQLRVFHSDPLDYHSIMDALRGCSALFYTFELPSDHPTYDEFMGEMEVRAAHNVLEACAWTDSLEKVVFTSSATAVIWRDSQPGEEDAAPPKSQSSSSSQSRVDERNWSDINFCKKFKLWHGVSKTMAERTAWALAMDRGVNMVSINAGLLMCQDSSIKDPYLLGAADMYKDGVFVTVDLKFLVDAHMCVFEDPSSYGRYLCFDRVINCTDDVQQLATRLLPPAGSLEPGYLEDDSSVHRQRISNRKLSKLMVDFYGGATAECECAS